MMIRQAASVLMIVTFLYAIGYGAALAQDATPAVTPVSTAATDQAVTAQTTAQATAVATDQATAATTQPQATTATTQGTQQGTQTQSFTLNPGAQAIIAFEAFCQEFDRTFPDQIQNPNGTASPQVQAALDYAQRQGLTGDQNQALQVQYAIWQLVGAQGSPAGEAIAQDVLAQGQAGNAPAAPQGATSVVDAANAGQVSVTLDSWQPASGEVQFPSGATDNFYGRGQMTVTNISQQPVTLYVPLGAVFPAADEASQDMVGYATNVQVNDPVAQQQAQSGQQSGQGQGGTTSQQQLPNTSTGSALPLLLLGIVGIALIAGGFVLRNRWSN